MEERWIIDARKCKREREKELTFSTRSAFEGKSSPYFSLKRFFSTANHEIGNIISLEQPIDVSAHEEFAHDGHQAFDEEVLEPVKLIVGV